MCPECGRSLNRSVYTDDNEYKSCPRCSDVHGRHAFHRLETFGERTMGGGEVIPQSWCGVCRGASSQVGTPELYCEDFDD